MFKTVSAESSPFDRVVWIFFSSVTDKKEGDGAPHVVVMPTPSKRGRKKKATTLARVGPVGGPGHETLILAHLTAGGQVWKETQPVWWIWVLWKSKSNRLYFNIIDEFIHFRWQRCIKVETHTICPTKVKPQRTAPRHTGTVCAVILISSFPPPSPSAPLLPAAECKCIMFSVHPVEISVEMLCFSVWATRCWISASGTRRHLSTHLTACCGISACFS